MPILASGPISMSMINRELGRPINTANSFLAGGSAPTVGSLFYLGNQSGSVNQIPPHPFSDWYNYAATGSIRRFVFSPYTASRSTQTTSSLTTINTTPTFTGNVNGHVVMFMATTDIDSVTFDANIVIRSGSTTVNTIQYNMEPNVASDRFAMGGVLPVTASAAVLPYTQSFFPETSSLTAGYAGYAMVVLPLRVSESFGYTAASTRFRDPGFANMATRAVTPGNYIVIGSAGVNAGATTLNGQIRMFDGTTGYGLMDDVYAQDTTNWSPYFHVFADNAATNKTYSLQAQSVNGDDMFLRQASVTVLNRSSFLNSYTSSLSGSRNTTSTTYVPVFGFTASIANPGNYHILIANAFLSGSSTTVGFATKLTNISTTTDYNAEQIRSMNATTEEYSTPIMRVVTFTQTTNIISWQLRAVTSGTAHLSDPSIVILDTGITGSSNPSP